MKRISLLAMVFVTALLLTQCAKNIPVAFDAVNSNQEVKLHLKSGKSIVGVITKKEATSLKILNEETGKEQTFQKADVSSIEKLAGEYDEAGNVISRAEIKKARTNKNLVLYSIGGTALSFGTSLFLSSVISRATSDSFRVVNPISIGGTVLGAGFFSYLGHKRDTRMAIEKIKDQRKQKAEKKLQKELTHKKQLEMELQRLKQEKEKAEKERQRLLKELKKKDKPE